MSTKKRKLLQIQHITARITKIYHSAVKYSLCFASVLDDSLQMGHQNWVHLLPVADIVEHTVSYTWALQGLCLRSKTSYFQLDGLW